MLPIGQGLDRARPLRSAILARLASPHDLVEARLRLPRRIARADLGGAKRADLVGATRDVARTLFWQSEQNESIRRYMIETTLFVAISVQESPDLARRAEKPYRKALAACRRIDIMSFSSIFVPREALVARSTDLLMVEVDGETVLMSVARGSYFGLARTAQDIWVRLEAKTRAGDLCKRLVEAYDGDAARIEAETLEFLGTMAAAGLITIE